ncbi:MAG: (deoxy)nucleoside triphosphate pyrophosphohydrolase [Sulfurimonadaceae bacterium]|nr:(deoxy)nucleoside triphosphate pyrophosphohydrolase [Sulfurimonadaceae bacterium]
MNEINAVGIALLDQENRVLIAQRPSHKLFGDKWEFPGGKIEPGESIETCIIREIKEELDVDVITRDYVGVECFDYKDSKVTMHLFTGTIIDNAPFTLLEHQDARWVEAAELGGYDFPAIDLPLIQKLIELLKVQ